MKIETEITQEMLDGMSRDEVAALNHEMEADLEKNYGNSMRKLVLKDLEGKERLEELIGVLKTDDHLTLDLNGIAVRIQRTLTKKQKRNVINSDKIRKDMTAEELEEVQYNFLAEICLDEPFNRRESWEKIDDETGKVLEIWTQANVILMEEIKSMRGFRSGRGPSPSGDGGPDRGTEEPPRTKQL